MDIETQMREVSATSNMVGATILAKNCPNQIGDGLSCTPEHYILT